MTDSQAGGAAQGRGAPGLGSETTVQVVGWPSAGGKPAGTRGPGLVLELVFGVTVQDAAVCGIINLHLLVGSVGAAVSACGPRLRDWPEGARDAGVPSLSLTQFPYYLLRGSRRASVLVGQIKDPSRTHPEFLKQTSRTFPEQRMVEERA